MILKWQGIAPHSIKSTITYYSVLCDNATSITWHQGYCCCRLYLQCRAESRRLSEVRRSNEVCQSSGCQELSSSSRSFHLFQKKVIFSRYKGKLRRGNKYCLILVFLPFEIIFLPPQYLLYRSAKDHLGKTVPWPQGKQQTIDNLQFPPKLVKLVDYAINS